MIYYRQDMSIHKPLILDWAEVILKCNTQTESSELLSNWNQCRGRLKQIISNSFIQYQITISSLSDTNMVSIEFILGFLRNPSENCRRVNVESESTVFRVNVTLSPTAEGKDTQSRYYAFYYFKNGR